MISNLLHIKTYRHLRFNILNGCVTMICRCVSIVMFICHEKQTPAAGRQGRRPLTRPNLHVVDVGSRLGIPEADTSRRPSGEKATELTGSVWPSRTCVALEGLQTRTPIFID